MLFVPALASTLAAQDLAAAARAERERKQNLSRHAPVLTNEDLSRDRILPAPDPAPPETSSSSSSSSAVPSAAGVPVLPAVAPEPGAPGFSLGEYARTLRRQKAARVAAESGEPAVASAPAPQPVAPAKRLEAEHHARVAVLPPPALQPRVALPPTVAQTADVQVRRGDSLWRISRRSLGHGHLWPLVWKANPHIAKPELIRIGQTIRMPSPEVVSAALAREAPKQTQAALRTPRRGTILSRASAPDLPVARHLFMPLPENARNALVRGTVQETRSEYDYGALQGLRNAEVDRDHRRRPLPAE